MSIQPEPPPRELVEALSAVRHRLGGLGSRLLYFSTIGSTNDVASVLASHEDGEGAVVFAEEQSAGRGRRGRSWHSPRGAGLYVSVVLAPANAGESADRATALVTLAAGLAIAEAVERIAGLSPEIKWPNDLLVGRRKLAGILAEGVVSPRVPRVQHVVLGCGINVGMAAYPPELSERVTSLESELGRSVDRAALFAEMLASLAGRYDDLLASRFDVILDAWRARSPGSRGARVSWDTLNGRLTGVTAGIDEWGALLVQLGGGQMERIISGEVVWHARHSAI